MQNDEEAIRELVENVAECFKSWRHRDGPEPNGRRRCFFWWPVSRRCARLRAAFAAGQSKLKRLDIEATSNIQEITVLGDWAYMDRAGPW